MSGMSGAKPLTPATWKARGHQTAVRAIGGERDRLVNFRVARATAARYPNGAYVERHQVFAAESSPHS
jgi:hypothetical protein